MTPTRRRFLTISAAAVALPSAAAARETARWAGFALGAHANMTLAGITPLYARPVFARLEAEIARLERIFSLYRDDSALARLNRDGRLQAPPPELLEVLTLSDALHAASHGAFDPSVQPLWRALATGGDTATARAAVGWDDVRFDAGGVRLGRPGMALTFNGIAQGYITDRIAALLRAQGLHDVLVDIGEVVALGRNADGRAWQAGIATPDGRVVHHVALGDRALATSAPQGTTLAAGQGHILDPGGGRPRHALVSVSAPRAALADGLSTALCLLDRDAGQRAVARFDDCVVEYII
ncbi:FAD:protein FMN transferase [Roseovarius ramblicola]|uniref:FAD:protein FMN transferase n=1 Tax=Roseovarius ramblicola TaxID=2022336 RepID=A0ABV5I3F9_9RHOB